MQFKYTLLVGASDEGSPVLSTAITVIIRVSRVNELSPIGTTLAFTFTVFYNSPVDTLVGKLIFTDGGWLFNNIKCTIGGGNLGSPPKFYIEPDTGMIKLLDALDRESETQYKINVRIRDLDNDAVPDTLRQRSSTAQVTVNILNMNDEPLLETLIYSTTNIPFTHLNCLDKDSPQGQLRYSIVGGVEPPYLATTQNFQNDIFQGIQDPMTFQLLIEITDELGGNKTSQLSATTAVIIHAFPWTTTEPTSSTKTTTSTCILFFIFMYDTAINIYYISLITTSVLIKVLCYWSPDNCISALLTLTGFLFVMCLDAIEWCLIKDITACSKFFPHCYKHQQIQTDFTAKEYGQVPR
ncbi:unnamed protein product [Rangifer tarandus platyrhynchus]|uniref:Uncharacterized protein n=2 Tax=Rangifer tarandus platyrhynchus TaxID=3082113 RepID=A0AC59YRQ3_RANTA